MVKSPEECVTVADCTGTAASYRPEERTGYEDNLPRDSKSGRTLTAWGNEGFNLDPPGVDPNVGEMAGLKEDEPVRTALDERHLGTGVVLWADGHATDQTAKSLGYEFDEHKRATFGGSNRFFSPKKSREAWVDRTP